ncbi:2OG-Fe(II) oxygenase [Cyanobacterium aponinum]|uniref:Prolyl 4-hydroxylase alpha subunit n=1 Tax=Cyanobacterium aponinum (strain PCC 10605) TaxID=755178 RepID=K9Z479_CYAAP|nr:2OG-Fe(II) oxygenase [Cyanobacterium aponinum]AFZ53173.1 Prolyl 4-hydroxylase alpha subunit [Cyanobacterium aponinum PCC 10605]
MIKNSLNDYINLIRPTISTDIIDENNWQNISKVAQYLPSALTTFFGFESRLGTPKAHCDFLLCADATETGKKVLGDKEYSIQLSENLLIHPVWKNVNIFGQLWNDKGSILSEKINNIWLEFDIDETLDNIPIPSCFFAPQAIYANQADEAIKWVCDTALNLLRGKSINPEIQAKLLTCLQSLPSGAYVFQIGLMLARESDFIRVCIRDISHTKVIEFLQKIGWIGSVNELKSLLNDLAQYCDRIDLDIDIGSEIAPKIGLECYLERQPSLNPKWQLFLEYLLEKGLVIPEKKDALLNYTGYIREKDYPELWPKNLSKLSSLIGSQYQRIFFKSLHHIKVVYQENKCLEAKAYLAVMNTLIDQQRIQKSKEFKNNSIQINNFLSEQENKQLLNFIIRNKNQFQSATLHEDYQNLGRKEENYRLSSVLFDFPEWETIMRDRISSILPDVIDKLGIPPFPVAHIEAQITAHNDHNYFKLHNDNGTLESSGRVLTFVYYLCQEPQPFTGGELKIYNSTSPENLKPDSIKTIEPINNSIVFFLSQYMHEVRPVNCPSQDFAHSRFTVNGWIWRKN